MTDMVREEGKRLILLKLEPKQTVWLVVEEDKYGFEGETPEERIARLHYLFEEHSCPSDIIHRVECIATEGDFDPHGIFEFVREVDKPEPNKYMHEPDYAALFPEMLDGRPDDAQ